MTARGCLSPQYILAEVYGNDIVKNYSSVSETSTLEQLKLRESDAIYAYELTVDFSGFVSQHYNLQELEEDKVKVGQLIDCRN